MNTYWVYMLASRKNGTLYIGVTGDLEKRIAEHKLGMIHGFTKEYRVDKLVWFDATNDIESALRREKQMKKWKRAWKIELIEKQNPGWHDISGSLLSQG